VSVHFQYPRLTGRAIKRLQLEHCAAHLSRSLAACGCAHASTQTQRLHNFTSSWTPNLSVVIDAKSDHTAARLKGHDLTRTPSKSSLFVFLPFTSAHSCSILLMGIKDFYQTLTKGGLSPQRSDIPSYLTANTTRPVHLDLLGTFYFDIMTGVIKCRKTSEPVEEIGKRLAIDIRRLFGTADITVHVDGRQCAEKKKARDERNDNRNKSLRDLDLALTTMEHNSERGVWSPKSTMRRIQRGLEGIFELRMEDKNSLSQGLGGQDSGIHVCRCTTEADFCIGHGATPTRSPFPVIPTW